MKKFLKVFLTVLVLILIYPIHQSNHPIIASIVYF